MPLDPESLYMQLGRLVETMPDLGTPGPIPPEMQQWLGRASALVEEVVSVADMASINAAISNLDVHRRPDLVQTIISVVHRALAKAELSAPATAQGAFIAAANAFDAFAAIGKVLSAAKADVLIVDPYMDEKALTDFALLAPPGVAIRLLADRQNHKPSLAPAAKNWLTQFGAARPLEARLTPARALHDRLIVADQKDAWTLTQSLAHFAARAPAAIVRVDAETAALKIAAYEAMWRAATPL